MDTESPKEPPRHGGNPFTIFITSLSAAIVVAGGFGIVFEAFIIAAGTLGPEYMFWLGTGLNVALFLWLAVQAYTRNSLAAVIGMVAGFAIVQALIIIAADQGTLSASFVWVASAANAAMTLWLALWTFARSWHVERRLSEGLEVDEPKLSILANFRGS